jgi:uncharacterized protein YneF (UPF0154 family)
MENLDLFILTVVVVVLYFGFAITFFLAQKNQRRK